MKKSDSIQQTLEKYFHHQTFRQNQAEIIDEIVHGRDVLAVMATGGGKSLCYQLPALMLDGLTVVISPLISLMKDQVDSLSAEGISVETINSLQTYDERQRVEKDMIEGKVRIVYVSPERAVAPSFSAILQKCRVSLFAVDEAHCISMWGHQFRPEYRDIKKLRLLFSDVPFAAFTATATLRVREDIIKELDLHNPAEFIGSFDRKNLIYSVYEESSSKIRMQKIVSYVTSHKDLPGIIYCFSRNVTEDIAQRLQSANIIAKAYHAGLSTPERSRIQEGFLSNSITVICATVAFGMGIDKPDVGYVIHSHMPKDIESYYQETGRAGRGGAVSDCIMYFSKGDRQKILHILDHEFSNSKRLAAAKDRLEQMYNYCTTEKCRRQVMLSYFGEDIEPCGTCDNCIKKSGGNSFDKSEIRQTIISAAKETSGLLTTTEFVSFLLGLNRAKTKNLRLTSSAYFGAAENFKRENLTEIVHGLIKDRDIFLEGESVMRICLR